MIPFKSTLFFILFALAAVVNVSETAVCAETRLHVIVGIEPYAYLAEEIGGDTVVVETLLTKGQDPHTFEPSPRKIASLATSHIYFFSGLEFERHIVEKVHKAFPGLLIASLENSRGEERSHQLESTENEKHHHHFDQHIWLSPTMLEQQAVLIAGVMSKKNPSHSGYYQERSRSFRDKLAAIVEDIGHRLAHLKGRSFYVFHPAFGEFSKAFGLQQVAVEVDGKRPSPKKLATLMAQAQKDGVHAFFSQPQFDQATVRVVADAIGVQVISIDPLAKNVLANYLSIADALLRSYP